MTHDEPESGEDIRKSALVGLITKIMGLLSDMIDVIFSRNKKYDGK